MVEHLNNCVFINSLDLHCIDPLGVVCVVPRVIRFDVTVFLYTHFHIEKVYSPQRYIASVYNDDCFFLLLLLLYFYNFRIKWKVSPNRRNTHTMTNKIPLENQIDEIDTSPKSHWNYHRNHFTYSLNDFTISDQVLF